MRAHRVRPSDDRIEPWKSVCYFLGEFQMTGTHYILLVCTARRHLIQRQHGTLRVAKNRPNVHYNPRLSQAWLPRSRAGNDVGDAVEGQGREFHDESWSEGR